MCTSNVLLNMFAVLLGTLFVAGVSFATELSSGHSIKLSYHGHSQLSPALVEVENGRRITEEIGTKISQLYYTIGRNRVLDNGNGKAVEDGIPEDPLLLFDIHANELGSGSFLFHLNTKPTTSATAKSHFSFSITLSMEADGDVDVQIKVPCVHDEEPFVENVLITAATEYIRDVLVIAETGEFWTISPLGYFLDTMPGEDSLMKMVLANPYAHRKTRLYASPFGSESAPNVQVWEFFPGPMKNGKVVAVFINGKARYLSTFQSTAHAEALAHPVMIAHPKPTKIALISDMPFAVLKEVLKYSSVTVVEVVGSNRDTLEAIKQYLPAELSQTLDDLRVTIVTDEVEVWTDRNEPDDDEEDEEQVQEKVFSAFRDDNENPFATESDNETDWLFGLCENLEFAKSNKEKGLDWERQTYCENELSLERTNERGGKKLPASDSAFDALLMDIPSYKEKDWASVDFQGELVDILDKLNGMLVISTGSPPSLESNEVETSKEIELLLHYLTTNWSRGGVDYDIASVYDEPEAAPLATAFIVAFNYAFSESYERFYRNNPTAVDVDMVARLTSNGDLGEPPTRLFDGTTHQRYRFPTRNWETWYCNTDYGKAMSACEFFMKKMFQPSNNNKGLEMRHHPVKGRGLYATERIPKGHMINFEDTLWSLNMDAVEWKALNDFIEEYPDTSMYKDLRDWMVAYGYEQDGIGISGWSAAIKSINTFTNHACTKKEINVGPCDLYRGEGNAWVAFSPPLARHPKVAAANTCALRDIEIGDEIQQDYRLFRINFDKHPYFRLFLTRMCEKGQGMVPWEEEFGIADEEL